MKKIFTTALTTALVIGAASTTFAAANPFSDVPSDHWAYDAVTQLAKDGIIEGYGDTTFKGDRNITRYELAQVVAKALAKENVPANDKAILDKLKAEFSDELNNLGVRVSNLERNADVVKWTGEMRNRYISTRYEGEPKINQYPVQFRLFPTAEVNEHWHVRGRLTAATNLNTDGADSDSSAKLTFVYADGSYPDFDVKLGKQPLFSYADQGLLLDDFFTGATVSFGKNLKTVLQAGRFDLNRASRKNDRPGYRYNFNTDADDTADYQAIDLRYTLGKATAGAAYRHFASDDFRNSKTVNTHYSKSGKVDDANIWSLGGKYKFDSNVVLSGAYAQNEKADYYDKSGSVKVGYKGADKINAGTWGTHIAYRHLGENTSFVTTYATFSNLNNAKGWEIGADYTPFHNVYLDLEYFNGKTLNDNYTGKDKVQALYGRLSFFF